MTIRLCSLRNFKATWNSLPKWSYRFSFWLKYGVKILGSLYGCHRQFLIKPQSDAFYSIWDNGLAIQCCRAPLTNNTFILIPQQCGGGGGGGISGVGGGVAGVSGLWFLSSEGLAALPSACVIKLRRMNAGKCPVMDLKFFFRVHVFSTFA